MKQTCFIKSIIFISLIIAFAACKDSDETDNRLSSVKTLIEPVNAKSVVLQPLASASLYFEWEACSVEESGSPLYQIAFDKVDGNFSNPVYMMYSDNNGGKSSASITHKQLNKIAGMMGIEPSATGTFKWAVFSSKGFNAMKSEQENTITITRLSGFADVPIDVFVTGEGSEGGTDLSQAVKMKAIAGGEFEVYTKLTAGKTYQFVDGTSGTPRTFYTDGGLVKEDGTCTVEKTGIYKVMLDFNLGASEYTEILKVALFVNSPQVEIELPYSALGIWKLDDYAITGITDKDDRYKFRMTSSAGESEWRAENNDSKPSGKPEYYYMVQRFNVVQWTDGQIWKSPSTDGWSGKTYDFMFSLSANGPYTHNLTIK